MFGGIPAFGGHSLGGPIERAATLTAKDSRLDVESETFLVAPTLAGGSRNYGDENAVFGFTQNSRSEVRYIGDDGQTVGALAAEPGAQQQNYLYCREVAQTITSNYGKQLDNTDSALGPNVVTTAAYSTKLHHTAALGAGKWYEEYTASLDACSPPPALLTPAQVRRLVPVECERLQGMADNYTLIPWRGKPASECPDGPRYKAIGNSKAVTVVRWIGRRLLQKLKTSPYGE